MDVVHAVACHDYTQKRVDVGCMRRRNNVGEEEEEEEEPRFLSEHQNRGAQTAHKNRGG